MGVDANGSPAIQFSCLLIRPILSGRACLRTNTRHVSLPCLKNSCQDLSQCEYPCPAHDRSVVNSAHVVLKEAATTLL